MSNDNAKKQDAGEEAVDVLVPRFPDTLSVKALKALRNVVVETAYRLERYERETRTTSKVVGMAITMCWRLGIDTDHLATLVERCEKMRAVIKRD